MMRSRVSRDVSSPRDRESVSRYVTRTWGWRHVQCDFVKRGTSDLYRIANGRRVAFLKIYRYGWLSRAEVQGEADLLEFLLEHDVRVAQPIRSVSNATVQPFVAPEGRRHAILFAAAGGTMPAFTAANSRKYGRIAGTIHRTTDQLPQHVCRPRLDLNRLAHQPLTRARTYLAGRQADFAFLRRAAGDLAGAINSLLPASSPEFGLCHGDLTFGNLRLDARGRMTLLDFDCSGYGWRAFDLAVFLLSRGFGFGRRANSSRQRQWNAFLDGYQSARRLSSAELQAVDFFVPLRLIWQLGQPGYDATHLDSQLDFMRHWLRERARL